MITGVKLLELMTTHRETFAGVDLSDTHVAVAVVSIDGSLLKLDERRYEQRGLRTYNQESIVSHNIVEASRIVLIALQEYPSLVAVPKFIGRPDLSLLGGAVRSQLWLKHGLAPILISARDTRQAAAGYSKTSLVDEVRALGYEVETTAQADAVLAAEWLRRFASEHRDYWSEHEPSNP